MPVGVGLAPTRGPSKGLLMREWVGARPTPTGENRPILNCPGSTAGLVSKNESAVILNYTLVMLPDGRNILPPVVSTRLL